MPSGASRAGEKAIRILLANNRYFPTGGPERYLFFIEQALRAAGHHVAPFSLAYEKNHATPAATYFPPPPVDGDYVLHGDRPLSRREKARLALRVIHDRGVYDAAKRMLVEQGIQVVYALQIAHYLYPDLLLAARAVGVPVVLRLSDYQLVCPSYNCLRDGRPCFACRDGRLPAIVHRCLKGSFAISATRVAAMTIADLLGVNRSVARFVTPSLHLGQKLAEAGFDRHRLTHLPTPLPLPPDPGPAPAEGPLLFVGGLYEAKGAHLAVEAVAGTGRRLIVVGDTQTPYGRALRDRVKQERIAEVEFFGFADRDQLAELYTAAHAVIVPSLWWENVPHVALEAHAFRRPVIAADHGSLPEVVEPQRTGLLFTPGDATSLRDAIESLARSGMADQMGRHGRERVAAQHDPARHLARLETVLREARG